MTPQQALSYTSNTALGTQIEKIQSLYATLSDPGASASLMGILVDLIALNEQLNAYDAQVAEFQGRCAAIVKANGGGVGVSPMAATVIGLGSAGVGGILGFAAAKMLSKPKGEGEGEEEET